MLQMIGKLCLFGGLSAIGVLLSLGLHRRVRCLRAFLRGLECLERELAFSLPPVEALLARLAGEADGSNRDFYLRCQERFLRREEERFEEIWNACLEEAELPLHSEDVQLLREVGAITGRYDGDSQRLGLRHIHGRLSEQLALAQGEAHRMSKVYGTLGVSLGLFTVILL